MLKQKKGKKTVEGCAGEENWAAAPAADDGSFVDPLLLPRLLLPPLLLRFVGGVAAAVAG